MENKCVHTILSAFVRNWAKKRTDEYLMDIHSHFTQGKLYSSCKLSDHKLFSSAVAFTSKIEHNTECYHLKVEIKCNWFLHRLDGNLKKAASSNDYVVRNKLPEHLVPPTIIQKDTCSWVNFKLYIHTHIMYIYI